MYPENESPTALAYTPTAGKRDHRRSTSSSFHRECELIWKPESPGHPPTAVLQLIFGRMVTHIVGMAAELGLADQIQAAPKTAEELATSCGLHPESLYRLLRALANFGIFAEQSDGRFVQTPMSDALRSDVPYSVRDFARLEIRPWVIESWMELHRSLQTGVSAAEHVHGVQAFDFLSQHAEEMEIFASAMSNFTAQVGTAVADAYDFSDIRILADIGGGHGMAVAIILARVPAMRAILFDLPAVVKRASAFLQSSGVAKRVEIKSGNFFEMIPGGADAYLLKHILRDWSDEDCLRILTGIHVAAKPGAKLLIVEAVLESLNQPQFAKTRDIERLIMTRGGKERTLAEWQKLLHPVGFRLSRIIHTAASASVIEAIRD